MATIEETSTDLVKTEDPGTSQALEPANPEKKVVKKIIRKKRRPARPQVDPATFKPEAPPQTGTIFNIWYNKWSGGDREDKYLSKTAAPNRCNIAKDSGYTRADSIPGSYFCLFFARGLCPKGQDCQYLHRLPTISDIQNPSVDCFGRDKFAGFRDDMGGVGSFLRQNRTLYVGRIFVSDDIEEVVSRHFQEWGQLDRVRVLPARGVAFVTYTAEQNAEFAKEAMAHQTLDHEEILNVRWATQDPNPQAQKREAKRLEEQAAEVIRAALPADYVAEIEGHDTEIRKRRKIEGDAPKAALEGPDERLMIEGTGNALKQEEDDEEDGPVMPLTAAQASSGLLSGSTLAALKGNGSGGVKFTVGGQQKPAATGALVGYGSDDDSD